MIIAPKLLQRIAAVVAGALLPFSLAPFNLLLVSYLGVATFAWLIFRQERKRDLFICALLFGLGLFGIGVSWVYTSIHDYGDASALMAGGLTAIFVVTLAAIFALPWILVDRLPKTASSQILGFASLWLLVEWLRSWILTGFPWLFLGHAHLTSLLSGWLPLIGVLGVGFLQAGICATLVNVVSSRGHAKTPLIALAISVCLFAMSPLLTKIEWTESLEPVQIALIQPDIPQRDKWDPALRQINLQKLIDLSAEDWGADILVWPEGALPLATLGRNELLADLEAILEPQTSLLTGRLVYDPLAKRYFNNVVGLGQASGEYSKRHLVPFGEYVPFESELRGLIEFFDLPMSVISSGAARQTNLRAGELSVGVAICYEIAYGQQVAIDSRDTNLLLTVSNDTWFGDSIGPHQHFQLAQVRAIETGKPVLRDTNNGITGIIDHRGNVVASAEQFSATLVRGELTPQRGMTPFVRWGETPSVAVAFLILLGLGWRGRGWSKSDGTV